MHKNEFWLRLLLVNGHKLTRVRMFAGNIPLYIEKPELWLNVLGLTPIQKNQFWSSNQRVINHALHWLSDKNHHLLVYADPNYPDLLRHINSAPIALFVQGNCENLSQPQIAMVGSRNYSHYGQRWGTYFAAELATAGFVVTSGLAIGIDAICHRGALDADGVTIAVLGSGLAKITPRCNNALANEILDKQGTLVSEFFPTEPALAAHFPRRNRIISGLSQGVFVIEAALRSGSLITARYALEQGREVFALPGALGNQGCEGTHWLIRQGANLVAEPTDIIELLNSSLHWLPTLPANSATNDHELELPFSDVFDTVGDEVIPIDIIADRTNRPVSDVMIELLDLELSGFIMAVSGGYIRNRQLR